MKIIFLASSGGPGGASVALFNLIRELGKDNRLYVVFPQQGVFSRSLEELGIKCFFLPTYNLTVYPCYKTINQKIKFTYRLVRKLYQNWTAQVALAKIVRNLKPDIIHTNVGPLDLGFKIAKKMNIKHVWHLREYQDLDFDLHFFPSKQKFIQMLQSSNSYSIAITRGIFNYWQLKEDRDRVIYDGVMPEIEHTYIAHKDNYFLFAGRIEEAKGVKVLLTAFYEFCKSNTVYNLFIAGTGTGSYMHECLSLIKDLKIEDRVHFLGQVSDIYKYMEKALALIVASRSEGFGFITSEAMYNHCLVIGKDTAGTKEQFDLGLQEVKHEIGFRFTSEQELLSALEKAIQLSAHEYETITSNAYYVVKKKYIVKKHASEVNAFYTSILQKTNIF